MADEGKSKLAQAVDAARGRADPVRDIPMMNKVARNLIDARRASANDPKREAYLAKRCTCGSGLGDGLCANCWPV
jgi:hypothetical protein